MLLDSCGYILRFRRFCTGLVSGLSTTTWTRYEAIHCKLGKFILLIPNNSKNVSAYVATDLKPLKVIFKKRIHELVNRLVSSSSELIQMSLEVAEVQGTRNQLFRDYQKFFGDFDEEFDLSAVLERETLEVLTPV